MTQLSYGKGLLLVTIILLIAVFIPSKIVTGSSNHPQCRLQISLSHIKPINHTLGNRNYTFYLLTEDRGQRVSPEGQDAIFVETFYDKPTIEVKGLAIQEGKHPTVGYGFTEISLSCRSNSATLWGKEFVVPVKENIGQNGPQKWRFRLIVVVTPHTQSNKPISITGPIAAFLGLSLLICLFWF